MKRTLPEDLDRQANLYYAYQHGVDFVRGDVKAEAEFKVIFAGDVEAVSEYQRGLAEESARQVRGLRALH